MDPFWKHLQLFGIATKWCVCMLPLLAMCFLFSIYFALPAAFVGSSRCFISQTNSISKMFRIFCAYGTKQ